MSEDAMDPDFTALDKQLSLHDQMSGQRWREQWAKNKQFNSDVTELREQLAELLAISNKLAGAVKLLIILVPVVGLVVAILNLK